jgi:hypothetical protein
MLILGSFHPGLQSLPPDRFQECTQADETMFVENLLFVSVFDGPFMTKI